MIEDLYWYCTDFIINTANLTGSSYFTVNSFLFFVLLPAITLLFLLISVYQLIKIMALAAKILMKI